jgi:hypothetical protein
MTSLLFDETGLADLEKAKKIHLQHIFTDLKILPYLEPRL